MKKEMFKAVENSEGVGGLVLLEESIRQKRMIQKLVQLSNKSDTLLTHSGNDDSSEKLDYIVSQTIEILDAELCSLFLREGNCVFLTTSYSQDASGISKRVSGKKARLPIHCTPGGGLTGFIAHNKRVFNEFGQRLTNHPMMKRISEGCDFLPSGHRYSQLAYPLLDDQESLIGLLIAYNKQDEKGLALVHNGFSLDVDVPLMRILSSKLMVCLRNDRLFRELFNYKQIIEQTPDMVIQTDRNGVITYCNRGAYYQLGEILGRKIFDFYVDDPGKSARKKAVEIFKRLKQSKTGQIVNFETELIGLAGEIIPVNSSICLLRNERNRIIGSIGIAKDLHSLKTLIGFGQTLLATNDLEDILKKVIEVCRKLPQSSHAFIGLYDPQTQEITNYLSKTLNDHHLEPFDSTLLHNIDILNVSDYAKGWIVQQNTECECKSCYDDVKSQIIVPIQSMHADKPKILGLICLESHEDNAFSEFDLAFLTTLAGQAAAVIENSNLLREKSRIITELSALENVMETITSSLDVDLILESLLDAVFSILGFDYASLSKVDPNTAEIGTIKGRGVSEDFLRRAWHSLDSDDIQAYIIRSREEINLSGWDDRLDRTIYEKFNHDNLVRIFLPILSRDQAFGTLETGYLKTNRSCITETEKETLRRVINLAGMGIDKAYLLEEQSVLVEQLQALNQAAVSILSSQSEEEAVKHIFDSLERIGYDKCMISIINETEGVIEGRYARGKNWQKVRFETRRELAGNDILALAIHGKKAILSTACAHDSRCNAHAVLRAKVTDQYVIPLISKDKAVGTLQIDLSEKPGVLKGPPDVLKRRLAVLDTFARQIAIAISNTRDIQMISLLKTTLMETAHEFRSPLHNIITQIGGLKAFLPDTVQKESEVSEIFRIITEEAHRASRQMENTLLYTEQSRMLRGYAFELGYLQDIILQCANNYKLRALERGISINVRDNIRKLPPFYFDKQKMEQVLNNLIDNAIKYSHYNRFMQIQGFDDGAYVHIEVSDKGLGIPESEYDHIFEGFVRGSIKDETRYIPGTGLGLKIAKEIITAHKGKISVKSTPFFNDPIKVQHYDGYDTVFTFILPKKRAEN